MSVQKTTYGAENSDFGQEMAFLPGYENQRELTNHLGNVLAVVSDRKIAVEDQGNPGTVEYYEADVVSAQDYYPFGMIQPGRSVSAGEYRYGFDGMEQDNEVKGTGNHYTSFYRQYDPRIGRWMSIDPKSEKMLSWSPYNFGFNNPVYFVDPEGDSPKLAVLASIGVAGAKGASKEYATQLAVQTLNNLTEKLMADYPNTQADPNISLEAFSVAFNESFAEAAGEVDWTDVIASGVISGGTMGLGSWASAPKQVNRINDALKRFGENVGQAIFEQDKETGEWGLSSADGMLIDYTKSEATGMLKGEILNSLKTGEFASGVLSKFATEQISSFFGNSSRGGTPEGFYETDDGISIARPDNTRVDSPIYNID